MTTQILWRDVCAMSKNLRKHLVEPLVPAEDILPLVQRIQPSFPQCPHPPSSSLHPLSDDPLVVVRSAKTSAPTGGLIVADVDHKKMFSAPQKIWLTDAGLLRQVVLYGSVGAGRTETLLSLTLNAISPRPKYESIQNPLRPRNVLHIDGKGNNSLYAKVLSGLSERGHAGDLRVLNLMNGDFFTHEMRHQGEKISHSLDLFDGFNEDMLSRWLSDMVPHHVLSLLSEQKALHAMMAVIARLAVAVAQQTGRRITLSLLAHLMTKEGALDHAQHLIGEHRHLARQWVGLNWDGSSDPERAVFLNAYHEQLTKPFQHLAHVFEDEHPEVSLCRLFNPSETPFYLLVLAPAMMIAPRECAMLGRAILTSWRLALERRLLIDGCDTLAVLDEFDQYLQSNDMQLLARQQNRGCGVVWGCSAPSAHWVSEKGSVFEQAGVDIGTHILMKQEIDAINNDVCEAYWSNHQKINPSIKMPSPKIVSSFDPGQSFVWSKDGSWNVHMNYVHIKTLRSSFIIHAKHLSKSHYSFSSMGMVDVDIERQTKVLSERLEQWRVEEKDKVPPLSWCQETVARMLGFANWHEAHARLGKKDA